MACYGRSDQVEQGFPSAIDTSRHDRWRTQRKRETQTKVDHSIILYLYLQLHALIETYMKRGWKVQGEGHVAAGPGQVVHKASCSPPALQLRSARPLTRHHAVQQGPIATAL